MITFCRSIILIICAWILLFGKSASSRFELISETVELQKEYPFGLGIDQFKYASLPFQAKGNFKPDPSRTFENPHSQILNFAIEQGLILFVFVMSLISIFLWKVITKTSQFSSSDKVFLFLSLGLWGIEYLFQFPLDVPLPSFSIAISMGYFVYFISIRRAQFFVVKPFVVVLLICFTAIKLATWTYSRYQFVRSKPNINELKVLRLIDPDFLFWDLELISQQMQSNKSEGLQYSKGLLKKSPFNYNLLALLTIEYSKQKNPEACHLANIFNSTFQKEKHMHIRLKNLNYCMNQKLLSPMQTHRAYKDLKNQLKN
ncbi:MAG: O-antigen ligase family protein [Bdellovibrionales bacterium]|nr:O-antigen ligase family protein [Bdellovibrionales bacterium]